MGVLVQMLRVMYRRDDKRVLDREARAVEQTRYSQAEVDQFRDVFMTWFEKDKVFEDEAFQNLQSAGGAKVEHTPRSPDEEAIKEISTGCMRRLLRSLGVSMNADHRKRLERKIDDFGTNGNLDFADFLRVMRWMLDTDFASIQR